jgi:hypothetical protein
MNDLPRACNVPQWRSAWQTSMRAAASRSKRFSAKVEIPAGIRDATRYKSCAPHLRRAPDSGG